VSIFDKVGKFGTSLKLDCSVNSKSKNLKLGTSIIQSIAKIFYLINFTLKWSIKAQITILQRSKIKNYLKVKSQKVWDKLFKNLIPYPYFVEYLWVEI